jgi:hypothetical protein
MIDFEKILPEFQEFLLAKKFVLKKNVGFYAYWVSKFIEYSNDNQALATPLKISKYIALLKECVNRTDVATKTDLMLPAKPVMLPPKPVDVATPPDVTIL